MILHHWDCDGICSAAMLIRMKKEENFTPKIGNYFIDEDDMNFLKNYDELKIVDMNLANASELCKFAKISIYDHHAANLVRCAEEHFNPYLNGKFYPSATLVVRERFNLPFDYLVALGIIGDNGPKTKKLEEYNYIKRAGEKERIRYEDMEKAVELIDSSYKLNDRKGVMENVYIVINGIKEVLENEKLNRNKEKIDKEIEKWASRANENDGLYILKMESEYHIISSVTRKIAWEKGKTAIVINHKRDRDELYLRSNEIDARKYIQLAKFRGYIAGGKKEVMGAIIPSGEGEAFFNELVEMVKNELKMKGKQEL